MTGEQQAALGVGPTCHNRGVGARAGNVLGELALEETEAIGPADSEYAEIIESNAAEH
jgi:hypothetical protein